MKKLLLLMTAAFIFASCSASREAAELRPVHMGFPETKASWPSLQAQEKGAWARYNKLEHSPDTEFTLMYLWNSRSR